ncbi:hypothetical protein B0H10DRAFT_1963257 [Mycena sp. CBHHK59/15]|nr:hypothetical protein B0H10DRAFT_1963257 [Mycena sp. CBHHK59/15]
MDAIGETGAPDGDMADARAEALHVRDVMHDHRSPRHRGDSTERREPRNAKSARVGSRDAMTYSRRRTMPVSGNAAAGSVGCGGNTRVQSATTPCARFGNSRKQTNKKRCNRRAFEWAVHAKCNGLSTTTVWRSRRKMVILTHTTGGSWKIRVRRRDQAEE